MARSQEVPMQNDIIGAPKESVTVDGITVPVFDFKGFQPNLNRTGDTVYVINFWATWCKPCIEEIPEFIKVSQEMAGEKVVFIFVSLDFRRNLETGVIPFIKSRNMNHNILLLNDPDANSWIGQVDDSWTGAIPATLIYRNEKRQFYEKTLTHEELKSIIHTLNNL